MPKASAALRQSRADAITGVDDSVLQEILREHWDFSLAQSPRFATRLGVRDYDDRLGDVGPAARQRAHEHRVAWLQRLHAIDDASLSSRDRVTRHLLLATLSSGEAEMKCELWSWRVSANTNPVEWISGLPREHAIGSAHDARTLLARYEKVAALVDAEIADLRDGLARGRVADAESIRRVLDMVQRQLDLPTASWTLLAPTQSWGDVVDATEGAAIATEMHAVIDDEIRPALVRYRDLLHDELLPAGRPDAQAGVGNLPDGAACYEALIERHTSLPLTAAQVHAIGREAIAETDAELVALARTHLGTNSLPETLARLREDPALYFSTPEEIEAAARDALARAKAAMPAFFGRLPQADCVVQRIPDYKAPFSYIGYYEPAHADGSKPGEYFVNVLDPSTRPRFEARVLAVHESIPGHHLQIAISQELDELPAFRRYEGYNAFVEGWALYTERLGVQMGLYTDELDAIGVASFDAWRAGRLVVDTGIHAMGWTRAQAEAYLAAHTALSPNNITNEVDRYVGWPGQALGYKIGQREILALRTEAEAALGDAFVLADFHDVVLGGGAMTLPLLRARVQAWVTAPERRP